MRRTLIALASVLAAMLAASLAGSGVAGAHTETDLVAVPAGSDAIVSLKPTHGCGGSPTVKVRIRAEVPGATAGDVDGWTATAADDGDGRTVLEWSGGSLPSDQTGAFPVHFTAPDEPGEMLLFPAIQICENGDDYAWIDGDPKGEYPAPRLLILPAGSQPAATIDEVPADAPGRDQLSAIVDVDNPGDTGAAGGANDSSTTSTGEANSATSTTLPGVAVDADAAVAGDDGGSGAVVVIVAALVVAVALSVGGLVVVRRRSRNV